MPSAFWLSFSTAEQVTMGLLVALVALVGVIGYRAWRASCITPEERERQRRAALVAGGKMGDGTLTELRDDLLFYAYIVRGVEYVASQDVSTLRERVPQVLSTVGS